MILGVHEQLGWSAHVVARLGRSGEEWQITQIGILVRTRACMSMRSCVRRSHSVRACASESVHLYVRVLYTEVG
jgi:hypothetical protein